MNMTDEEFNRTYGTAGETPRSMTDDEFGQRYGLSTEGAPSGLIGAATAPARWLGGVAAGAWEGKEAGAVGAGQMLLRGTEALTYRPPPPPMFPPIAKLEEITGRPLKAISEVSGKGADYLQQLQDRHPEWQPALSRPDVRKSWASFFDPDYVGRLVAQQLPIMAASIGAGVLTGGAGGVIMAGAFEAGSWYDEAVKRGVDKAKAADVAIVVGAVNGALEYAPLGMLAGRIKGATGELRRRIAGEAIDEVAKLPLPVLRRMATNLGKQIVSEATTETLQEITSNAAKKTYDKNQAILDSAVLESAVAGGWMGLIAGTGGEAISIPAEHMGTAWSLRGLPRDQVVAIAKEGKLSDAESKAVGQMASAYRQVDLAPEREAFRETLLAKSPADLRADQQALYERLWGTSEIFAPERVEGDRVALDLMDRVEVELEKPTILEPGDTIVTAIDASGSGTDFFKVSEVDYSKGLVVGYQVGKDFTTRAGPDRTITFDKVENLVGERIARSLGEVPTQADIESLTPKPTEPKPTEPTKVGLDEAIKQFSADERVVAKLNELDPIEYLVGRVVLINGQQFRVIPDAQRSMGVALIALDTMAPTVTRALAREVVLVAPEEWDSHYRGVAGREAGSSVAFYAPPKVERQGDLGSIHIKADQTGRNAPSEYARRILHEMTEVQDYAMKGHDAYMAYTLSYAGMTEGQRLALPEEVRARKYGQVGAEAVGMATAAADRARAVELSRIKRVAEEVGLKVSALVIDPDSGKVERIELVDSTGKEATIDSPPELLDALRLRELFDAYRGPVNVVDMVNPDANRGEPAPPTRASRVVEDWAGSINQARTDDPEQFKEAIRYIASETETSRIPRTTIEAIRAEATERWNREGEVGLAKILRKVNRGQTPSPVEMFMINEVYRLDSGVIRDAIERGASDAEIKALQDGIRDSRFNTQMFIADSNARRLSGQTQRVLLETSIWKQIEDFYLNQDPKIIRERHGSAKNVDWANPRELAEFASRIEDPKLRDYFYQVWYNTFFANIPTQLSNMGTNTAWALWQLPHTAIRGIVDKVGKVYTEKDRAYFVGEVLPMLAGMREGFTKGRRAFGTVMKTGELLAWESKLNREIGSASINAWERSPHAWMRKAAPYVGGFSRVMRAMDVWANIMAFDGHMRVLGYRDAMANGVPKADMKAYVDSFCSKPSLEVQALCAQQGRYATFTDAPGKITARILATREDIPLGLGRIILPFVNTIGNLTKRGVEMTPGLGLALSKGQPIQEVLAKQMEGVILTGMLLLAKELGFLEFYGAPPDDPAERAAFLRQHLPYSVKVGPFEFQYSRVEPFNVALGVVANAHKALTNTEDEEEWTKIFENTAWTVWDTVMESHYLHNIMQSLQRYGDRSNMFKRLPATLIPAGGLLRTSARIAQAIKEGEATYKETDTWTDIMAETIPGLADRVPDKLNVWGEEIGRGNWLQQLLPWRASAPKPDLVEMELDKLDRYPGLPGRNVTIRGEPVEIPEHMYREYCIVYGKRAKEALDGLFRSQGWERLISEDVKEKVVDRTLRRVHDRTLGEVKRRYILGK